MKKNLHNNKTKLIARAMLLVLLLTNAVNLGACSNQSIQDGFTVYGKIPSILCAYKVDKKVFDIDNVYITFYYGITYYESAYEAGTSYPIFDIFLINDEKEYLVRTVDEELVSSKYGVDVEYNSWINNVHFEHSEVIKIPRELFDQDKGYITFLISCEKSQTDQPYFTNGQITFCYELNGQNIKIKKKNLF